MTYVAHTGQGTANSYFDEAQKEALRRQYELGRKDGYDEAVRMIKRAADEFRKAQKPAKPVRP